MIVPTANPGLTFRWVERWPGYAPVEAPPFGGVVLIGKRGREILCVAVKVSASLESGLALPPEEQEPLCYADAFEADGCLVRPSDFAPADRTGTSVIIEGALEQAEPGSRLEARFQVGQIESKVFAWGDRTWRQEGDRWIVATNVDVSRVPLSHRLAFGGAGFASNPVGMGYHERPPVSADCPLHRVGTRDTAPDTPTEVVESALPLPISPAWAPRRDACGTYDASWKRGVAPFPALDQRPEFFDVVPPQFVHRPFLRGGEALQLEGFATSLEGPAPVPRFGFHLVGAGFGAPFQLELLRIDVLRSVAVLTFASRLDVTGRVERLPPLDVVAKRLLRQGRDAELSEEHSR